MEISLHSSKKHRAIGYYFSIIRALISSKKNPLNKLYYADLYCGDGKCIVESTGKSYNPPIIDSLLKPAKERKIHLSCFLNDLEKIEEMKKNTKEFSDFIEDYGCEDANTYYKKALQKIPPDQFSIFFLDPTNHSQLRWSTIKKISEHTHTYYGNQIRRPELIINLMTYTMLGSYKSKSFQSINDSLGTDEWIDEIEKNKEKNIQAPIERAFLTVFIRQLESLGYKVPTPIKITSTSCKNVIYYLIWATNERGHFIIENRLVQWINKLMDKAQKENVVELKKANARKKGIIPLSDWVK